MNDDCPDEPTCPHVLYLKGLCEGLLKELRELREEKQGT